ncbi:MAG TPA: chemotaxis protein CheB [Herpetosiphonaceae bacterium]
MEQGDSAKAGQRPPGSALAGTGGSPFPVIGLGASAGGLEALHTFFAHLRPDTGMAFVVILHLSPTHESQAAALLQRQTSMPVQQVTAVVPLVPNHVYVIPPSQHLELVDGHIRLAQPQTEQDRHAPIDHFFRTLADTHTRHAVAIILSGSGSDGTIGIMRIKEWGGAIFVQDPEEAAFTGMPRSAIATGLVDDVLPVARMPERLISYWRQDPVLVAGGDGSAVEVDDALLQEILAVLRVHTHHDFSQYKRPTVLRRIGRRMQVVGVPDLPAYLAVLRQRPEEVPALLQDLLISVTNFFRDPPVWTVVAAIIPQLFAGKGPGDQIRVWVPACATGEEAYTVAMLLLDHALTLDHPPAIQVFATDIDEPSIAQARRATYRETIAGNVDPERLRRFFVLEQGRYRVSQEVRELVMFATHNVLRDPPFTKLDLITCRNLLIYLTQAAQAQVIQIFQFSLRPGGYLLLGTAESLDGTDEHFVAVAKAQHLYRRSTQLSPPPVLTIGGGRSPRPGGTDRPPPPALPSTAGDLHQRLLLAHMPASALISADYEIVHLTRGANRFLHLEGEPSTNLLRLVHPDLRLDLHTLLFQAGQGQQRVERRGVRLTVDATVQLVDLLVEPVADGTVPDGALLVLFADAGTATAGLPGGMPEGDGVMRDLSTDLARTQEQLQITIEQYATSSEEYQAANEELQAINEELRAASEELETSKEELQAVNEELSTVNQQLKHTVAELTATNNDLQNLIAATEIATLFLDRALCITRYTPSAETIFHLIPTDRGRPLAHVTHTLQDAHLADDAAQVLRTLIPIARELASANGHAYLVQIRPYRTTDDHIAGIVITCVDITERTQAAAALAERARLLDLSNDAIIVRDVDDRIIYWNHGATDLYGWTRDEAVGQHLHTLLQTEFEAPLPQLVVLLQQHDRMEGEVVQVTREGRHITAACRWALDRDAQGRPGAILTTYNDITERKQAEAERERLLVAEHAARLEAEAALTTREQFLSIASHELRTPLTALIGNVYLLPTLAAQGPDQLASLSERITRQAHRLNALVDQLLDVSRLQQGQFVIEPQPTDLAALVAEVVDEFRITLPEGTTHTVAFQHPDAPILVAGDAPRLEQVLQNLLSNAVKYSPQGGPVHVRVQPTATEVILEVEDRGMGIPSADQARLFEPFYRASNGSRQASGFGVGLYIVHEIVQRHGGRIAVASTEGQGSTFRVTLPLLPATP